MIEPSDHARNRGAFESMLRAIPGFRGYLEKEYRRDSDELQRTRLADRLQRAKRGPDELARRLTEAAQIDLLPPIDRLRGRLDKLIGRIRAAMQGYSGFFDLVQVDEPLLERVYEYDLSLIAQVEALAQAVEALPARQADARDAVAGLLGQIDQLERQWDGREDLLRGLQ